MKKQMPVNRNDIDPPIESTGDKAHRSISAAFALLPYGSGRAVKISSALITPPLEKRKNKWMTDVSEAKLALEAQVNLKISKIFSK